MNILKDLEKLGADVSWDLIDLVHAAADEIAAQASNDGLAGQVAFLKNVCGWSEQEILNAAKLDKEKPCEQTV